MSRVVDTIPQELVSTHEEEVIRKEQEERRQLSHGINATPQEPASTPVDVVMHEVPVQPRNDDEGFVPCSPFQSMIPRGARGFCSPKRLVEEVFVPLVLKFFDMAKGGRDTTNRNNWRFTRKK